MGCGGSNGKNAPIRKKVTLKKQGAGAPQNRGANNAGKNSAQQANNGNNQFIAEGEQDHEVLDTADLIQAPVKKPTQSIIVSETYNKDKLSHLVTEFQNMEDKQACGETPASVLLFEKDYYSTKDWTPMHFAIYNKSIKAVRYFIEHKRFNRRLSTQKKTLGPDETRYNAEAFPLIIAISNQDHAMLDYLWSMNELWDYEHLKIVLQIIFTRNLWTDGMRILLGSEATQDIYNSLSYNEKKQFMLELFYRYLHYAPEGIKDFIKTVAVQKPYSLIALHYMMTENDPSSCSLIEQALNNITLDSYARMKYEADQDFIKFWNAVLTAFIAKGGEFYDASVLVEK